MLTKRLTAGVTLMLLSIPLTSLSIGQDPIILPADEADSQSAEPIIPSIRGRIVPINAYLPELVEIRFETEGGRWMDSAYTNGNGEFEFPELRLTNFVTAYFLIVEADGFVAHRERLFWAQIEQDLGDVVIFLEAEAPEPALAEGDGPPLDIRQLLAEIPPEAREAFDEAATELDRGQSEDAIAHLERAVELAPDFYEALNVLGVEYVKADRFGEAETPLARAREINPNDPRPLMNLGMLYFEQGQVLEGAGTPAAEDSYLNAIYFLDESVRLDPLVPQAHLYLGSAYYKVGAYDSAEAALQDGLDLDPGLSEAHLTLLNVYTRSERYEDALDQIAAYLEANPNSPQRGELEAVRLQIENAIRQ